VTQSIIGRIGEASRFYSERLIDFVYNASVLSVVSYAGALLILIVVGLAVADHIIHVPVFHPDIPVFSGS
jgi:hypothetical protein